MSIKPGKYLHFKGNEYEVIGVAAHSETLEEMVVYRALYGDGGLWVRPAEMWNELVEMDGKIINRFKFIGDSDYSDRKKELSEAHRALLSTLIKCEKIDNDRMGKSQRTLLFRRISALKVALALIEREMEIDFLTMA
jgi:hypothetical protein